MVVDIRANCVMVFNAFGTSGAKRRAMKISFLQGYLSINGSVRHIIEMANELVQRDHEVTIYSQDSNCSWLPCYAQIKPQKQVAGGSHDVLIFNNAAKEQWRLMEQAKADCKLFYLVGMGDKLTGKEILKEQLIGNAKAKGRAYIFKQCLEKYTVICNGTWMYDFLANELGYGNVYPVLNGVNTDMFRPVKAMASEPTVVMSGDPRLRYETHVIRSAVNQAKRKIGELDLIEYFGKGIPQLHMAAFYSQGWVFADAQNRAGWNNPVAEAMACGVPVACTDIGGNKDFAIHDETALIVPVGDVEAMAAAIVELIEDGDKAERLAANALEKIRKYTWAKSIDQLLEAINKC